MTESVAQEDFNANDVFLVSDDYVPTRLCIYRTEEKSKKVKSKVTGRTKTIKYQEAIEYLDEYTGEIISREKALSLGVTEFFYAAIKLQQQEVMDNLRKEVKQFAEFVLMFRNRRRGITPNINELCKMYADLTGMRSDNIRRYIPKLKEEGILANDTLLMPVWQIPGKSTKGSDHLTEEFEAQMKFERLKKTEEDAIKIRALTEYFTHFYSEKS